MITQKSLEQLAHEDLVRQILEAAAKRVESLDGNPTYQQAWKIAARSIRSISINGEYS